jgi:hypothetical protein
MPVLAISNSCADSRAHHETNGGPDKNMMQLSARGLGDRVRKKAVRGFVQLALDTSRPGDDPDFIIDQVRGANGNTCAFWSRL